MYWECARFGYWVLFHLQEKCHPLLIHSPVTGIWALLFGYEHSCVGLLVNKHLNFS